MKGKKTLIIFKKSLDIFSKWVYHCIKDKR